jgi:hypothetical protein
MSELHLQGKHLLLATMPIQHMEEGRLLSARFFTLKRYLSASKTLENASKRARLTWNPFP